MGLFKVGWRAITGFFVVTGVYLPVYLFLSLLYLSIYLFTYLRVYLDAYLPLYLYHTVHLFIQPSVNQSICLSIYLIGTSLCMCLPTHLSLSN